MSAKETMMTIAVDSYNQGRADMIKTFGEALHGLADDGQTIDINLIDQLIDLTLLNVKEQS